MEQFVFRGRAVSRAGSESDGAAGPAGHRNLRRELAAGVPTSDDAYAMACEQYARTAEGNNAYRAFVALWILCALRMADGVDLMIDIDRLGQSREYAAGLRAGFEAQTGLSPDFSSARDLVEETRRSAARMAGIDGRSMRAVHSCGAEIPQNPERRGRRLGRARPRKDGAGQRIDRAMALSWASFPDVAPTSPANTVATQKTIQ